MPKTQHPALPLLLSSCLFFGGCADVPFFHDSQETGKTQQDGNPTFVHDKLLVAADGVYAELKFLNDSSGRRVPTVTLPTPISGCLLHPVSIDYDGPASRFLDDFKGSGFCQVRVIGKAPPQDLILSLHHHRVPLWHVIEDIGVQMGSQANIEMTADSVVIRYHGQIADIQVSGTAADHVSQ